MELGDLPCSFCDVRSPLPCVFSFQLIVVCACDNVLQL